ncbi:MAG: flagellar biosynthetic protein FliO [Leptospirales bacterium]
MKLNKRVLLFALIFLFGSALYLFSQSPATSVPTNTEKPQPVETNESDPAKVAAAEPTTEPPNENKGENKPEDKPTDTGNFAEDELFKQLDEEMKKAPTAEPEIVKPPSWGVQILKMIIVLAMMFGVFYLIWKFFIYKKKFQSEAAEVMRVIHTQSVSPGKSIQIMELSNRLLVIGNSDAGLQLITEIKDKPSIDQIKLDSENENSMEKRDFWVELSKTIAERVRGTGTEKSKKMNTSGPMPWDNMRSKSRTRLETLKKNRENFNQDDGSDKL